MGAISTGTTYPARIMFALREPLRSRVRAAAQALGLVAEDGVHGAFIVTVPDQATNDAFARLSADLVTGRHERTH